MKNVFNVSLIDRIITQFNLMLWNYLFHLSMLLKDHFHQNQSFDY